MVNSPLPPARRRFRGVHPEQRVAQRRQKLLEAGLSAFGTRGFHAAGVRDICALAKLTERYFYESFKNREALFDAVHESEAKKIEAAMVHALLEAPREAKQLTRAGLRAVLKRFQEDPRAARVLLIEVIGSSTTHTAFATSQTFAKLIELMALELYPNVTKMGVDPGMVANGLYGSTVYIAMRWTLGGFQESLERVVEHCALFYDSLLLEMAERESVAPPPLPSPNEKRKARRAT